MSAEFGRFSGGVVNAITKSGGNRFSGSFRTTFNNDDWRAVTPLPGDRPSDSLVPVYEYTVGGPILRDRLWFFHAGRYENEKLGRNHCSAPVLHAVHADDAAAAVRRQGHLQPVHGPHRAGQLSEQLHPRRERATSQNEMDLISLTDREDPESTLVGRTTTRR